MRQARKAISNDWDTAPQGVLIGWLLAVFWLDVGLWVHSGMFTGYHHCPVAGIIDHQDPKAIAGLNSSNSGQLLPEDLNQ